MNNVFTKEFSLIEILESECELLCDKLSNVNIKFLNDKITFRQSTNFTEYNFMSDSFKDVNEYIFNIKNNNTTIKILNSMRIEYSSLDTDFKIYKISSDNFDIDKTQKARYKILLPCSQKIDYIRHYGLFECFNVENINTKKVKSIILPVDIYEFKLYSIDGYSIIIDSIEELDFKLFDKYYRIVLTAYCFITGFAPVQKGYIFGYYDNSHEYKSFVYDANAFSEYTSKVKTIDTNVYNYSEDKSIQDELISKLKPVSKDSIRNLTNCMLNNSKFYDIMDIMFNINKIGSFGRSTASLYAVCLEIITSIICQDNKYKSTINNKTKKKELQKELDQVAQDYYKDKIPDEEYNKSVIKKRINSLLQPTNRDKLRLPFEILKIKLSDNDLNQLERRNDLLHGNNLFTSKNLTLEDEAKEILYLNFQLNYLVNALILKYIGYRGVVKNLSKIIKITSSLETVKNEKPYKVI